MTPMKQEQKHTPDNLPFNSSVDMLSKYIYDKHGKIVATVNGEKKTNRDDSDMRHFIVTACNEYAHNKQTIEELAEALNQMLLIGNYSKKLQMEVIKKAESALSRAGVR